MTVARTGALGVLSATGAMLYRDSLGNVQERLIGTEGRVLTSVGGIPVWSDVEFERFAASEAIYPTVDPASPGVRGDVPIVAFADSVDSGVLFSGAMDPSFVPVTAPAGANTFRITVYFVAATAVGGSCHWRGSLVRQADGDAITRVFGSTIDDFAPAPGVNGVIEGANITFDATEIDSIAAGNPYRFFLERIGTSMDTMVGDAQVLFLTAQAL